MTALCADCVEAAAERGIADVAWWCWMFGCSLTCRCDAPEVTA